MPSPTLVKKQVKVDILAALDRAGSLYMDKTISEFCLSTGFNIKTIKLIIEQMNELGYITIDGNVIKRPEQHA